MSANPENRLKVALVQMQSQCELRKNIEQAISFLSDAIETHQYEVVDFYDHLIIYQHENIYPVSVRQNLLFNDQNKPPRNTVLRHIKIRHFCEYRESRKEVER